MPLNLFYTMVQKSQKWPKTQIKGGGPALRLIFRPALCGGHPQLWIPAQREAIIAAWSLILLAQQHKDAHFDSSPTGALERLDCQTCLFSNHARPNLGLTIARLLSAPVVDCLLSFWKFPFFFLLFVHCKWILQEHLWTSVAVQLQQKDNFSCQVCPACNGKIEPWRRITFSSSALAAESRGRHVFLEAKETSWSGYFGSVSDTTMCPPVFFSLVDVLHGWSDDMRSKHSQRDWPWAPGGVRRRRACTRPLMSRGWT